MFLLTEKGSIGMAPDRPPDAAFRSCTLIRAEHPFVSILWSAEGQYTALCPLRLTKTPPWLDLDHLARCLVEDRVEAGDRCRNVPTVVEQLDRIACSDRVLGLENDDLSTERRDDRNLLRDRAEDRADAMWKYALVSLTGSAFT